MPGRWNFIWCGLSFVPLTLWLLAAAAVCCYIKCSKLHWEWVQRRLKVIEIDSNRNWTFRCGNFPCRPSCQLAELKLSSQWAKTKYFSLNYIFFSFFIRAESFIFFFLLLQCWFLLIHHLLQLCLILIEWALLSIGRKLVYCD